MFYNAIVTDTSDFYKTGQIRVRVAGMYNQAINYNLADKLTEQFKHGLLGDMLAKVFSPLGGGRNYGVFFLPQVNEKGIVASIMEDNQDLIWLGSLFDVKRDEQYNPLYTNLPSDDPNQEGVNTDGSKAGKPNMEFSPDATSDDKKLEEAMGKHFVLRTKTTKLKFSNDKKSITEGTPNTVDWENQDTTNIVTIAEDEIKIIHFSKGDGWDADTPKKWQEIKLKKDPDNDKKDTISVKVVNKTDSKESTIAITDEEVKLEQKGDKTCLITMKDGDITIKGDPNIILNEANDTAVRFSKLKKNMDFLKGHIHIAQGPSGPTTSPQKGPSGGGEMQSSDIDKMESENIQIE
jgi:hypothetical protein